MTGSPPEGSPAARAPTASELRLRGVPWAALAGLGPALAPALSEVLANAPAERVVDRFLRAHRELDRDARRVAKEAIYGVAVWRRRIGYALGDRDEDHDRDQDHGRDPLALLAALLRDLGGVADPEALLGLPPGALPPPRPPPDPALRFSLPDWLWATLEREAGDEAAALADALNLPGPVALRPNTLRTTPQALARALADEGLATRPGTLVPTARVVTSPQPNLHGLAAFRDALFEVQDEGSQHLAHLVGARPGDHVLDLCAGAGGKTLALACAVAPTGMVHACDPDPERLARLARRAARAGAAHLVRIHGATPPPGLVVDAALVDAPCSELGALRRGPDRRFHLDPAAFAAFPPLQLELLARAAAHLRPGGRLLYATCTLRREEDEDVAAAFLAAHPGFAGGASHRTWPHREGCDGFFAALFHRAGAAGP
jgi:16S rRNA (cytosine967-C5)-methyltransferase